MNQSPSPKKIHIVAIAAGTVIVGAFFWSTISTLAFNGPTAGPPTGSGAVSTDVSNNVYIGGNLNVTGTISSAGGLGASTLTAGNVSAGQFGSNVYGGNYTFPANLGIGTTTAPYALSVWETGTGSTTVAQFIQNTGGANSGDSRIDIGDEEYINSPLVISQNTGGGGGWTWGSYLDGNIIDTLTGGTYGALNFGTNNAVKMTIAPSGYVGIGTSTPATALDVAGDITDENLTGQSCVGTNGTGKLVAGSCSGASGANPSASIGTTAVNGSASTFMRSDGAPTINQAAAFTFSALGNTTSTANISALTFKENTSLVSTSTGANPSASIGTTAVNGSANTFMRSDGAPTINQAAAFTFSALGNTTSTANISAATVNITGGGTTGSTITAPTTIGKCASTTVTITGATSSTGAVFVAPVTYPGNGYVWQGYVSSLNTVVVEECAATTTTGTATKFSAIYIQ